MNRRKYLISFGTSTIAIASGSFSFSGLAISQDAQARPSQLNWVTQRVDGVGISFHTFHSNAIGQDVSYHIYTPARYLEEENIRLPVIYWLHGSGGGIAGISRLASLANDAIETGKAPPFIVVFVNGLRMGMYVDWANGNAPIETIIVKELIPHIDSKWRTIATREGRIIEGFSMGGYGAARLGFRHINLFGSVSMLGSGPLQDALDSTPRASRTQANRLLQDVYGGDQDRFRALSPRRYSEINAPKLRSGTRIRLVVGEKDETFDHNNSFHLHLNQLGIPHDWLVLPDVGHNPMEVLTALGDNHWAFYRAAFAELKN